GASQVREMTQHIVSLAAEFSTTCCADGRWRCAEGEEDPEQPEIGSWQKSRTENKHKNKSQRLKLNLALFAKTHSTKC
ncbi:hypothetical protein KK422_22955, partial [Salmonella enterica subsp. enterica serovar Infantis]|uniref:hypothetical protein n=1 Tax=Salmonella enterica TaxID=28901 RepID=UPI001CAA791D